MTDVNEWRYRHADARKSLEFDRDRVGAPGCDVRKRADHLLRLMDEWERYRSALCRIGSMGLTDPECSRIAIDALKGDAS
jgi:hypothetical protein